MWASGSKFFRNPGRGAGDSPPRPDSILNEPSLKVFQINVETFKGEVQLSGFVDSSRSVNKAGEVARSVKDVKSVKNNLIVK
ncbi:MAG: hypothetical protein B7Z62_07710 [Deltaproteobacteria bacterium 37-65-8]|nr:MAG: hypothetical protein B7Z62_07710 [Deltaproteobacteria bacterium 37-65-8]